MIGVRISDDMGQRLASLAKQTHRTKSFYVKEALERYLEDIEDHYLAAAAYEEHLKSGGETISLEDLAKKYALEA